MPAIGSLVSAGAALPLAKLPVMRGDAFRRLARAQSITEDEAYWAEIQRAFDLDRTMVNLNNGGCSPAPTHVLEQMIRDLRFSNELPVEHMWSVLEPRIESVRRELARDFGCDGEEMAITRNASESNETMILGMDLKRGDEVSMIESFPTPNTIAEQAGALKAMKQGGLKIVGEFMVIGSVQPVVVDQQHRNVLALHGAVHRRHEPVPQFGRFRQPVT